MFPPPPAPPAITRKSRSNPALPPAKKKIEALAEVKTKRPPAYCFNARVELVETVAVPAVIVVVPLPILTMSTTSEAAKIEVFTVIVVAELEFI
jgi:hypothetical protein